ncbi:hypothetical protein GCM10012286_64470 [Streptomyces lasiicapitis]|uniref:Uncharacterized protein n=1 Tax=Streptomyces lasiicapitis TaxID=1923961 RepID=A0ABQ2MMR8_9ACTN|nr:hypothetical protein GCM10012286_64470 [Streptomyces lasiicapitis]
MAPNQPQGLPEELVNLWETARELPKDAVQKLKDEKSTAKLGRAVHAAQGAPVAPDVIRENVEARAQYRMR